MKLARLAIAFWLLFSAFDAAAETVAVTRKDCSRLIQHVPLSDAAYKPGVDVKGKPVAPADLPGGGNDIKLLPDVLEFNISLNPLIYQSNQAALAAKGLDNTSMTVAAIKYDIAKNRFTINDQPLGSPALQELADACAKAGVK